MYKICDSRSKINLICSQLNVDREEVDDLIKTLYIDKEMSGNEISEYFYEKTKLRISARSIQRAIRNLKISRTSSDGFKLAAKNGKINWATNTDKIKRTSLPRGIRLKILTRDNFKCVYCGRGIDRYVLEIDHIKPVVNGGTNEEINLQTLCTQCNVDKQTLNNEVQYKNYKTT